MLRGLLSPRVRNSNRDSEKNEGNTLPAEPLNIYAECTTKRTKPNFDVIDEELTKEIGRNYRTLPTFEKTVFDTIHIKHYSLVRNELLKCRWDQYKKNFEKRVFAPFQFPDARDLHFYNGSVRFVPSQSIHRTTNFRMKLKPGPGVDQRGQMPIPNELFMKRGTAVKEKRKSLSKTKQQKDENDEENEEK